MIQASPGPDPHTRTPAFRAPPGSTDCHAHLYGPFARYPLSPDRNHSPVESGVVDYIRMLDTLGIDRAVNVQGSAAGYDNQILLDAIAAYPERLRGIAVIDPRSDDRELARLAAGGICGVRLSNTLVPRTPLAMLGTLAPRIAPLGWHLQIHLGNCDDLPALEAAIAAAPVPILIDHMASTTAAQGVAAPGFAALLRLMTRHDHVWTKMCAFYRRSGQGPPYADMRVLGEAIVAARPDRVLWGSNWPHPQYEGAAPNDGALLDLFAAWVPDAATRQLILVRNPATLFGFAPA